MQLDDLQKKVAKALEDKYVITADKAADMAENWLEYASAASWTKTVEEIAANIAKQEELNHINELTDQENEMTVETDFNEFEPSVHDPVIDDAQTFEENQLSLDLWEENTIESTNTNDALPSDSEDEEKEEEEDDDSYDESDDE